MNFDYAQVPRPSDPFEFPSFPPNNALNPSTGLVGVPNMSTSQGQFEQSSPMDSNNTPKSQVYAHNQQNYASSSAASLSQSAFLLDSERVGCFSDQFKRQIRAHTDRSSSPHLMAWTAINPSTTTHSSSSSSSPQARSDQATRESSTTATTSGSDRETVRDLRKDYLGQPQPVQAYFALNNKEGLVIPHETRIPISHVHQLDWLLLRIPEESGKEEFRVFASTLLSLLLVEEHLNLNEYLYSYFNPASSEKTDLSDSSFKTFRQVDETERKNAEVDFLNRMITSLLKSNFHSLTEEEFKFAHNENSQYLFAIPIQTDWSSLDASLLKNFFASLKSDKSRPEPPPFAQHCLVFWRGIREVSVTDPFTWQKLESLLTSVVNAMSNNAFVKPVVKNLFQSQKKLSETSIHEERLMTRTTLTKEDCQWNKLLEETTLVEPMLEELVLIFRRSNSQPDLRPEEVKLHERAIYIQRFHHIPLKDIDVIFPSKRVGFNFADYFYYGMVFTWIVTAMMKFMTTWSESTYLDEFVIGILFILLPFLMRYFVKVILSMGAKRKAEMKMQDTMTQHSLNCNTALITYLQEVSRIQSFKEIILAFFVVLQWGPEGITSSECDACCESLIKEMCHGIVDFRVHSTLNELIRLELIEKSGDRYFPSKTLSASSATLESRLREYVKSSFI